MYRFRVISEICVFSRGIPIHMFYVIHISNVLTILTSIIHIHSDSLVLSFRIHMKFLCRHDLRVWRALGIIAFSSVELSSSSTLQRPCWLWNSLNFYSPFNILQSSLATYLSSSTADVIWLSLLLGILSFNAQWNPFIN